MSKLLILSLIVFTPYLYGAGRVSQFEQKDIVGTTDHLNLVVGAVATLVPTVAGRPIAEALVRCPYQIPISTRRCLVAFDNGANYITLRPGEFIAWSIKGYRTQITVEAATAGTNIEVILNREP